MFSKESKIKTRSTREEMRGAINNNLPFVPVISPFVAEEKSND